MCGLVAVVGSRSVTHSQELHDWLNMLLDAGQLAQVVSGGAAGADALAGDWARRNGVPLVEHLPGPRTPGQAYPWPGVRGPAVRPPVRAKGRTPSAKRAL